MFKTLILCVFCILAGCAPGLGSSLNINAAERVDFEKSSVFLPEDRVKVGVLRFTDARNMEAIASIDGRLIKPDGDPALAAQRIFEIGLKNAGAELGLFNVPTVRGTIREWKVIVHPGFPASTLEAEALVAIELLDLDGNPAYRADYSGSFQQQNPFLDEENVQRALGNAMRFAVEEAVKDSRFTSKIAALASRTGYDSPAGYDQNTPSPDMNDYY